MKWLFIPSLLGLYSCFSHSVKKAEFDIHGDLQVSQIDTIKKYVHSYPNGSQFSIGIIIGDTISKTGLVRKDDTFFTTDNYNGSYEIGSLTKVFTASLLTKSSINIDDPISKYLDFPMKSGDNDPNEITFRHLANHTSGLPRLPSNILMDVMLHRKNPYKNYEKQDLYKYLREDLSLDSKAGKAYAYSNLGAGLLGQLLADHHEMSYEEAIKDEILSPLFLNNTFTNWSQTNNLVHGLNHKGKKVKNWDFKALAACGTLLSSLNDMLAFTQLQFSDTTFLRETHQVSFNISEDSKIALGWHIKSYENMDWYWHNGGTGGYTSCLIFDKEANKAIIVLSNMSALAKQGALTDRLALALMNTLY